MNEIKISVIIPCYNVQNYVGQCLQSIGSQNYRHLEIICINDGSTDDTLSVLNSFAANDSRIIIVNQDNQGLSETRNKGISIATGEYLMFVDSDDWVGVGYFDTFLSPLKEDVDLVIGSYTREFATKSLSRDLKIEGKYAADFFQRRLIGLVDEELRDPSQADSIVTIWSKLYKFEIIKDHAITFDPIEKIGTAEDLLFNLKYSKYCDKIFVIDQPLYHYRKSDNSFTNNYKSHLFNQWKNLFECIQNYCDSAQKMKAYHNRVALSIIGLGLTEIRNPAGSQVIKNNLNNFLSDQLYRDAFSKFDTHYLPLHWKLFFFLAKNRFSGFLYQLLLIINKLINKNN